MTFSIEVAELDADKQAAYRLRFAVRNVEMGDRRYGDPATKVLRDRNDDAPTILFVARRDSEIIGTLRLSYRRSVLFMTDEIYPFRELGAVFGLDAEEIKPRIALVDRGVVGADMRRQGVYRALFDAAHHQAICDGMLLSLGVVQLTNQPSIAGLTSFGYVDLGVDVPCGGMPAVHLYKDLRSVDP